MVLLLLPAGLLGLAIGSFLNVVIHRVPVGASVVSPPSHCPRCETPIRMRHNVPVVGWLFLRGRCADCELPIPVRYPLVELLTAVLFVLVTWRALQLDQLAAPACAAVLHRAGRRAVGHRPRRPPAAERPGAPGLPGARGAARGRRRRRRTTGRRWCGPLLGAAALFGFFFLLAFVYPSGMGFGDVKLAGVIGLLLGYFSWGAVVVGAFAGFFLGAVVGVAVLAVGAGRPEDGASLRAVHGAGALAALWITEPVVDLLLRR